MERIISLGTSGLAQLPAAGCYLPLPNPSTDCMCMSAF